MAGAALYRELAPDLMISGHWAPREVDADYLDLLAVKGAELARMHRDLLPLTDVDFDAEGVGAWIRPYQAITAPGRPFVVEVEARNPFAGTEEVLVRLVLPDGWRADPAEAVAKVPGRASDTLAFVITPARQTCRRARIAADLTVGDRHFGQHAEALVDVR